MNFTSRLHQNPTLWEYCSIEHCTGMHFITHRRDHRRALSSVPPPHRGTADSARSYSASSAPAPRALPMPGSAPPAQAVPLCRHRKGRAALPLLPGERALPFSTAAVPAQLRALAPCRALTCGAGLARAALGLGALLGAHGGASVLRPPQRGAATAHGVPAAPGQAAPPGGRGPAGPGLHGPARRSRGLGRQRSNVDLCGQGRYSCSAARP